jgi:hypothetical protein
MKLCFRTIRAEAIYGETLNGLEMVAEYLWRSNLDYCKPRKDIGGRDNLQRSWSLLRKFCQTRIACKQKHGNSILVSWTRNCGVMRSLNSDKGTVSRMPVSFSECRAF